MKKFTIFSLLVIALTSLLSSCINSGPKANINDLQIVSGIRDHKLMFDGGEGSVAEFSFRAKHDWQIIDYKGFTCDPSSGKACQDTEFVTVTAKTLKANNSADTVLLSPLNFKLLSTRFVGIEAFQLPQIRLPKGNKISVDAASDAKGSLVFVSKSDDVEIIVEGELEASLSEKNSNDEYTISVTATTQNVTPSDQIIGTIGFKVGGVKQASKIEVVQISAIVMDRSEVLLPGKAGGENILVIDSSFDIVAKSNSTKFEVTKQNKVGSTYTFAVKAKSGNSTAATISLGDIEIALADAPDCSTSIEVKQRKAKAPQTIVVHFIGTALQSYFKHNVSKILEGLNANIQGDAQVMVVTTDSNNTGTLYELRYDKNLGKAVQEKVKELTLPTPYDYSVLKQNIGMAINFAAADKYALVIGSHGLGWIPVENYPDNISRQLSQKGEKATEIWKRDENAEMTRHLGDKDQTRYDISELARAIKECGIKLDYLLFDACFMGNIESAYELRNVTDYIIGSPCEVMGYGFPYAKIMKYMLANGGTSYDLDKICSEYVNYYKTEATTASGCVALTKTSELEALAAAMKEVFNAEEKVGFSLDEVQYYEGITPHVFFDLEHIVELSCGDAAVAAKFKAQLAKTVTSRYHTDRFYSAYSSGSSYYHDINYYSGITTSYKCKTYKYDWEHTEWYKATH